MPKRDDGSLGPPDGYGGNPETRPEGNFSGRLREAQAKSARAAMVGMAERLQLLATERLRRLLVRLTRRLLEVDPQARAGELVFLPEPDDRVETG